MPSHMDWLGYALAVGSFGLAFLINIYLTYKEQKRRKQKQSGSESINLIPIRLKISSNIVFISSIFFPAAGVWLWTPELCIYGSYNALAGFVYVTKCSIFWYQLERLHECFGSTKTQTKYSYPNWFFNGFRIFILITFIFDEYTTIAITKTIYYQIREFGCNDSVLESAQWMRAIRTLGVFVIDWTILILFAAKIGQLSRILKKSTGDVVIARRLNNILKKIMVLLIVMECTWIGAVICVFNGWDYFEAFFASCDTILNIKCIMLMFDHNNQEYEFYIQKWNKFITIIFGKCFHCCNCWVNCWFCYHTGESIKTENDKIRSQTVTSTNKTAITLSISSPKALRIPTPVGSSNNDINGSDNKNSRCTIDESMISKSMETENNDHDIDGTVISQQHAPPLEERSVL